MKRKVALFGGTFDPIHEGHVSLLEEVKENHDLDECIIIPCKQSPHKEDTPLASDLHRYVMCKLATRHLDKVVVSDLELKRSGESYSWMTVEHYLNEFPEVELYWVLGTDQWAALERWGRFNFLREHLTFIVVERQEKVLEKEGVSYSSLSFHREISSTQIRASLLEKKRPEGLNDEVYRYIQENHLYFLNIWFTSRRNKV